MKSLIMIHPINSANKKVVLSKLTAHANEEGDRENR